jgi:hypothetical protein
MSYWFVPFQAGLFSNTVTEFGSYPLTCGKTLPPTERTESFHMAVGNLRCFNAAFTNEEGISAFFLLV